MCRGEWWWWWVDEAEELSRPAQVSSLLSGRCRGGGEDEPTTPVGHPRRPARTHKACTGRTDEAERRPSRGHHHQRGRRGEKKIPQGLVGCRPRQAAPKNASGGGGLPPKSQLWPPTPTTTGDHPRPATPATTSHPAGGGRGGGGVERAAHPPSIHPTPPKKEGIHGAPPPQNKTTNDTQPAPHDRHTPWTCPAWRPCASPATTGTTRT